MEDLSKMRLLIMLALGLICACANVSKKTSAPDTNLRLITYNVWKGFTEVSERKTDWIKWIEKKEPDVLSLQELNGYTPERLKEEAEKWDHPYTVLLKKKGFPTGITSRYPLKDVKRILEGFHHGLLRAKSRGIYFYVVHLHPSDYKTRMQEINLILEDIGKLPKSVPIVLAGDFNSLSHVDSIYYSDEDLAQFFRQRDRELNENNLNYGKLDYSVIKKITENGFVDTEVLSRPEDYCFTGTFPTSIEKKGNHGANRRLDYIFVNNRFIGNVKKAKIITNNGTQFLSDHLPILVDFRID